MTNVQQRFKIEIRNENGESISYTTRSFGEVGKDIVAIKLSLGVLVDIEGVIGQNLDDQPVREQPMDPNGWFDCTTGRQISFEQAATFDSKMQTALTNYQVKNQFLILSYLFKKYAIPGIINSVGENYNSSSSQDQVQYLATVLSQLESIDILFESELGNLGEATLAVMHGWSPHSVAGNSSYYHTEAMRASLNYANSVVDVLPFELIDYLIEGNLGQTQQELIESGNVLEISDEERERSSPELNQYIRAVSENERWISINGIPNFAYGFVRYSMLTGENNSILYNSTLVTIQNYQNQKFNERIASADETSEKLRQVFYPDPFSTTDVFYISEHLEGFYLETDFVLDSAGPLPKQDQDTIQSLEEEALRQVLQLKQKPDVWFLVKSQKEAMRAMFGSDTPPAPEHTAVFPEGELFQELKKHIPRFIEMQESIDFIKEELNALPEQAFGAANDYVESRRTYLEDQLEVLESEYSVDIPTEDERKDNIYCLGTEAGINRVVYRDQGSIPDIQTWRHIEGYGSEPPLIKFKEYKTPSLRPGQKYRALFEISTRKMQFITTGLSESVEEEASPPPTIEEDQNVCLNDDTEKTLRSLEEYRIHARKRRREIVRELRDAFKQEPALRNQNSDNFFPDDPNIDTNTITPGQIGPFNLNRALDSLLGFDINGASDYEYTKGVLSRLGDVGTAALEGLGVLDTDIDYFNNIANKKNKQLTKKDANGKPAKNTLKITLEEFEERIQTAVKDLQESDEIIAAEGIAFKKGSKFNARKESVILKQFFNEFKGMVLEASADYYGQKVSAAMNENPDKCTVFIEFQVVEAKGPDPHTGPLFGKRIVDFGAQLPEKFKIGGKAWPYAEKTPQQVTTSSSMPKFLQKKYSTEAKIKARKSKIKDSEPLSRPRTVNYVSNIYEMTGLFTDKPGEIISVFDDGRGSCKDLGVNLDKKLASSYISNYTTGVQVQHPPGDPSGFSWKKFAKENFKDPAKDWANTSAKNWENSFNDSFDEQQALKLLGEMCTLEDLYKEFFDKLDLVSLLCDWLKCIRLPNFNLKLPNFYLPPFPQIPILGWYAAVIRFFIDNIKQILVRIVCTFVRSIIDKLAIPFCEEQLQEFIAAGSSSGSPIMDRAIADSLMNTGVPSNKKEEAKKFFDDVASITTGQELCHLLSGKPLDDASMLMIQRLLEKNGLEEDLDTRESLMNYFDLLGSLMPDGICEELQKSTVLNAPSDCLELADFLQDIRNRLQTEDSTLSDEEIENVINLAKEEMEKRKESLAAFSGNNIGSLLPQAYGPGNPDAIISSYPDFLKKELEKTAKNSFTTARMSYVNALDSYVPNLSISAPSTPRAGTDRYNDIQSLNFEAAATQLALYAQGVQSSVSFATKQMLQRLNLPADTTKEQLESYVYKGREINNLVKVAKSWINKHIQQIGANKRREHGGNTLESIRGSDYSHTPFGNYPAAGLPVLQHLPLLDEIRFTSRDGTREQNTMYTSDPGSEVYNNPFLAVAEPERTALLQKIIFLIDAIRRQYQVEILENPETEQQFLHKHFDTDLGLFGFRGMGIDQAARLVHVQEMWQSLQTEPFNITFEQIQWINYFTNPLHSRHEYGYGDHIRGSLVDENLFTVGRELEAAEAANYDYISELIRLIRDQESITAKLGREHYNLLWAGYRDRIKQAVHDGDPEWYERYEPPESRYLNPFIQEISDYRIANVDDTINKLKLIIKEYMEKIGFNPEHVDEDGYLDVDEFFGTVVRPAYRENRQEAYEKYYVHQVGGTRDSIVSHSDDRLWWANRYSGKKVSSNRYSGRRYKYYVWNSSTGNQNHTEQSFIEHFINPVIRSKNAGIPWNHELRNLKTLDTLEYLTRTDVDPYTAAITSVEDIGGISWWNTLLLFSVFETEEVPLQTRSGTHKVFKRAELPIDYSQSQAASRNFGEYKEFVAYYRRPPVEGTVHDYVQGDRTFNYVPEGFDGLPTFEERGAVYDEVFNKIIPKDPFPIETFYTPYERFYEQTNDPLEKAEHAMIVPAYLVTAAMTGEVRENIIQYRIDKSNEQINQEWEPYIQAGRRFNAAQGRRNARNEYKRKIAAYLRGNIEERTRLNNLQIEYASSMITTIEQGANAVFKRNLPRNHPARIAQEDNWNGVEHLNYIDDFIFLLSIVSDNEIEANPDLQFQSLLLENLYIDIYPMVEKDPPSFYRIMRAALDSSIGVYTVYDPATGDDNYVPIFPVSQTNAAADPNDWLRHTYSTLTSMAVAVHGGVPDFFRDRTNRDRDEPLDEDQLMSRFVDFRQQGPEEASFTISLICQSLNNTVNSPNLIKFATDRLKELTDTIQRGLEFRPNFVTDRHLLMLDKILKETQIAKFFDDSIELFAEFGTYQPKITFEEIPAEKDFDRYTVTVRSDFNLRMPNATTPPVKFQMCEFLPESMTSGNNPSEDQIQNDGNSTKYFSKRESFKQIVLKSLRSVAPNFNPSSEFKNTLYDEVYKDLRNSLFSRATNVISTSDLFDIDYATTIDDRLSAEPIYDPGTKCVTNRYGLVEAATLSFNKVIMEESYTEIMKEISKPENSPFNRDFDDPHPLELAMQSISLKAFIRVCLIDTLLKGGLVYSVWDIEPIISSQLFKDYVFEHVSRELKASRFFGPNWKRIIERAVGITNPSAALKQLLEKEMVKLPDYSKQVFNFTADKRKKDYYNWPLENMLSFAEENFVSYTAGWQNTKTWRQLADRSPLRTIGERIEQENGGEPLLIWDYGKLNYSGGVDDLRMENYIRLSGEIIENLPEIHAAIYNELFIQDNGYPLEDNETLRESPEAAQPFWIHNKNVTHWRERYAWYFPMLNGFNVITGEYPPMTSLSRDINVLEGESFVTTPRAYDALLSAMHAALPREQFLSILENSTIHHGSRLLMATSSEQIINAIRTQPGIRRKSFLEHAFLGVTVSSNQDAADTSRGYNPAYEILALPLAQYEHELKIEDCGLPSGDMFSDTFLSSLNNNDHDERGIDRNAARAIHQDFVSKNFQESEDFKNITEHIFPLRRFLTINSIFATSIISGYNGIPVLFDSVKTSIAFVAKVASTPSSQQVDLVQITPEQFGNTALKNWPTHPQSADCFDFPLPGGEFFKKFIEDLWKLIKQLPSILFRGVANQLDPAYKEMRQHYLNCNIKNLTWDGIRIYSAMDSDTRGLVNGLVYPGGIRQGQNAGKYVPILPSLVIDELISRANLLIFNPAPLGRTIARTITYAFNGNAPFFDLSMAFQVPCAGINEDWWDNAKYDIGKFGRYGHPISPFTALALSTPQLESDKKLKRPNCVGGRPELASYDECDE